MENQTGKSPHIWLNKDFSLSLPAVEIRVVCEIGFLVVNVPSFCTLFVLQKCVCVALCVVHELMMVRRLRNDGCGDHALVLSTVYLLFKSRLQQHCLL